MPIYAYKCSSCGHAQDILQKVSDAPLTLCTACGAETFSKQLTAAGFQLKGNGWYATDFRNGSGKKPDATKPETATTESKPAESKPEESKPADSKPAGTGASTPAASGCSGGCACS